MSTPKNLSNVFMPHGESRRSTAPLAATNAEIVHDVNGDESAIIYINGTGTLNCTYQIEGSADGVNYHPVLAFPHAPASLGGTLPQPGQAMFTEAVNAATVQRMLCLACGGLQRIRLRLTAYSSGSALVSINSDACNSLSPFVRDQRAATLFGSVTAAVGVTLTLSLPAVAGFRHYIDSISVVRNATAALTASATPVLITTTNLPNNPTLTMGSDAGGIGVDREVALNMGGSGLAATAINTPTTIVCPAYVGVIWRINAAYRLGL
jgi:hypothetical protein